MQYNAHMKDLQVIDIQGTYHTNVEFLWTMPPKQKFCRNQSPAPGKDDLRLLGSKLLAAPQCASDWFMFYHFKGAIKQFQ